MTVKSRRVTVDVLNTLAVMRLYPTSIGELASVTSVLSATESKQAKARLVDWNKKNPDGPYSPKHRGSFVDDLISSILVCPPGQRVLPNPELVPEFVRPYVQCLVTPIKSLDCTILDAFGPMIWVQGIVNDIIPRDKRCFYKRPDGVMQEYIYSTTGRYAGVPDFVGEWKGKLSLISLKTCSDLYASNAPDFRSANDYKKEHGKTPEAFNVGMARYMRYEKALMQESAYKIALNECLGIYPEQIVILVVTQLPRPPQIFTVKQWAMERGEQKWFKRLEKFHKEYSQEVA